MDAGKSVIQGRCTDGAADYALDHVIVAVFSASRTHKRNRGIDYRSHSGSFRRDASEWPAGTLALHFFQTEGQDWTLATVDSESWAPIPSRFHLSRTQLAV